MTEQLVYLNGEMMPRSAAQRTLREAGWSEAAVALFTQRVRVAFGRELHPDVVAAWCREPVCFEEIRDGHGRWVSGGGGAFAPREAAEPGVLGKIASGLAPHPATPLGKIAAGLGGLAQRATQALGLAGPGRNATDTPGGKWLKIAGNHMHLDDLGKVDDAGPGREHLLGIGEERLRGLAAKEGHPVHDVPLVGSRTDVEAVQGAGLHDRVKQAGAAEVQRLADAGRQVEAKAVQRGLDRVRGKAGGYGNAPAATVRTLSAHGGTALAQHLADLGSTRHEAPEGDIPGMQGLYKRPRLLID